MPLFQSSNFQWIHWKNLFSSELCLCCGLSPAPSKHQPAIWQCAPCSASLHSPPLALLLGSWWSLSWQLLSKDQIPANLRDPTFVPSNYAAVWWAGWEGWCVSITFFASLSFPLNQVSNLMYCLARWVLILPVRMQQLGMEAKQYR